MRSVMQRLLALAALAALSVLGGCLTEATGVVCYIDTDVPANESLTVRATARMGIVDVHDDVRERTWTRGAQDGGFTHLPASFGIVPGPGDARDGWVTLVVEAMTPDATIHRTQRFRFIAGRTVILPLYLAFECIRPATGCMHPPPGGCTVQALCEEQGLTCGNDARCTDLVTATIDPQGDAAVDFGPAPDVSTDTGNDLGPPPDVNLCVPGSACCGAMRTPCSAGQVCTTDGTCATCGVGHDCCTDGAKCATGQACNGANVCVPCGGDGQVCCEGGGCSGGLCQSDVCHACGAVGQSCCTGGVCAAGSVCDGSNACVACGATNQPCCGANCNGGNVCRSGTCAACGGNGQTCCAGNGCGGGLACSGGSCTCLGLEATCGGGVPCCGGSVCASLASGGLHCCRQSGQGCNVSTDCCGSLICWNYGGTTGKRCR